LNPASQAAGRAFLRRFRLRTKDRDPEVKTRVPLAQRTAIVKWAALRAITRRDVKSVIHGFLLFFIQRHCELIAS
jgi:hypothetical protein